MTIYYDVTAESQPARAELSDYSCRNRPEAGSDFAKIPPIENDDQAGETLAVPAVSQTFPLVYNSSTLPTVIAKYKAKSGRAARKPFARLPAKQLTTPQLLKFEPKRGWRNLVRRERTALVAKYTFLSGALAFSLNFDHDRAALFKASADPVKKLADEIQRLSKIVLGKLLDISFALEVDAGDRLHCHGIVILEDHAATTKAKLNQILKRAGGVIHGNAAGYQLHTTPMHSVFWNSYMLKDFARTAEFLGTDKLEYLSRPMLNVAKVEHDRQRRMTKALGKPVASQGDSPACSPVSAQPKQADDSQRPSMAVSGAQGGPRGPKHTHIPLTSKCMRRLKLRYRRAHRARPEPPQSRLECSSGIQDGFL